VVCIFEVKKELTKKPNLKEIQRKAYTSYHQDGLIDIFASVYITVFAAGILMDFLWDFSFGVILPGIILVLIIPLWVAAKRKITVPRIGYVNFGAKGSAKLTGILIGLTVLGIAFLFIFAMVQAGSASLVNFIVENGMIITGIAGLMVCFLFGYAMGLRRMYVYGMLALAFFAIGYFTGVFFAYIILALGITVAISGINLLVNFVRKYPLRGENVIVA